MALSPQSLAVTRGRRNVRAPRRSDMIRSQYGLATQGVLQQRQQAASEEAQQYQEKQDDRMFQLGKTGIDIEKQKLAAQERSDKMGLGLQGVNLGMNIAKGGTNLAGRFPSVFGAEGITKGFLGGINPGTSLLSGGIGTAGGQILGGDNKVTRGLVGGGIGALTGALAGEAFNPSDMIAGGFLGALGSFF